MESATLKKTRFIVFTALMAAVCYATTYIHIEFSIGGASSSTMVHLGSAACFLASLLLGGLSGGIAGGIGMSAFDLFNHFQATSPWTLVIKFLTGYVVGKIAWSKGRKGNDQRINIFACVVGGLISLVGYAVCDFVMGIIANSSAGKAGGNAVIAALVNVGSGIVGSIFTTIIAIIIAVPFNDSIKKALGNSKLLEH